MNMKLSLFLVATITSFLFCRPLFAASDSINVELGVYHCDNDALCEVAENPEFCPLDCVSLPASTTEDTNDAPTPPPGIRTVQQIIDLFQTFIPFVGGVDGGDSSVLLDGSEYVCTDGSCTAFTDDLTRSVVISFEESYTGMSGANVSIKPISGEDVVFAWEEGVTMRIMRSPKEFPIDPMSGELVYEGASGGFSSLEAAGSNIMYYSLFPRRSDGSYGNPEFVIIKIKETSGEEGVVDVETVATLGTFIATILVFVGRFIFLLI